MPELIIGNFSAPHGKGKALNSNTGFVWGKAEHVDISVVTNVENGDAVNYSVSVEYGITRRVDVQTSTISLGDFFTLNTLTTTQNLAVYALDETIKAVASNDFSHVDSGLAVNYHNILPYRDLVVSADFNAVKLFTEKPKPPGDYRYLPTSDFNLNSELVSFSSDFVHPIDYDKLVTPLSPVNFTTTPPWARTKKADVYKRLSYGYGLNDFLVGGGAGIIYPVDEDAVSEDHGGTLPPDNNTDQSERIITIVNTVAAVALPSRTPLLFSAIRLNKHIDSFSWDCSITLLNDDSYNLIKPTSIETKDIEVTINGTTWEFFIGKVRKVKQFGSTTFVATGYSHSAKLQAPYSALTNYSNASGALASQLISEILTGTGFSSSWSMPVNWPIAAGGFSYQGKSIIDAVAQIASAAGAIIEPDLMSKTLTIKPWCADSAWNWNSLTGLPAIDEALCFELSEQYNPQDQANAVYVSGNNNGVILKGKLPGTAGNKLLPSVADNLITDTSVASERARIELSKAGHKEDVPITTFIDSNSNLYIPGSMVAINMSDTDDWNGLVTNLSVSVEGAGVSVLQTINVSRHYDS